MISEVLVSGVQYVAPTPSSQSKIRIFSDLTLEHLSAAVKLPIKQRFLHNPTLGTNLGQRVLAMRTGCICALAGVPWRGSVSARSAWGDLVSFDMLSKVLNMLSILRRQGAPLRAHLQLHEDSV